jgi:hypothetical protein
MKYKLMLLMLTTVIAGLLLALSFATRPTSAQDKAATLRALLEQLKAESAAADNKVTFSIEFAVPLVSGERGWLLPDTQRRRAVGEIGDDYICFTEPWNDTTRQRCTPFSNIVSVTFTK